MGLSIETSARLYFENKKLLTTYEFMVKCWALDEFVLKDSRR